MEPVWEPDTRALPSATSQHTAAQLRLWVVSEHRKKLNQGGLSNSRTIDTFQAVTPTSNLWEKWSA